MNGLVIESPDVNCLGSITTDGCYMLDSGSDNFYFVADHMSEIDLTDDAIIHGPSFQINLSKRHLSNSSRHTLISSLSSNIQYDHQEKEKKTKRTKTYHHECDNDLETDDGQLFATDLISDLQSIKHLINDHDKINNMNDINNGINDLDITASADLSVDRSCWEKLTKPDSDGDNLIFIAIITKSTSLLLVMVSMIPDITLLQSANKMFQTALHLAVLTDNVRVARRLVVGGIEVDRRDMFGNTALHIACKRGNLSVATELLTPVSYLETKQNLYEIPYQKIPQCMDVRNFEGQTCLHILTKRKCSRLYDLLLSKNADINAIEMKAGKTCLHIFAENGNADMVKYLLSKSALKIDVRTFAGFTAVELAHYRGHDYIVSLLLFSGALPDIKSLVSLNADDDSGDEIKEMNDIAVSESAIVLEG